MMGSGFESPRRLQLGSRESGILLRGRAALRLIRCLLAERGPEDVPQEGRPTGQVVDVDVAVGPARL